MRNLFSTCSALAVAMGLLATPALTAEPSGPTVANPTALVDSVSLESLTALLTELGAQQVQAHEAEGSKFVTFMDGSVPYYAVPTLCEVQPGKCVALTLTVFVDPGAGKTYALESLNAFHKDNLFATVVRLDGNKFGVGRILLVEDGVTRKNLAINIGVFAAMFHEAMKRLTNQVVAAYQPNGGPQRLAHGSGRPRAVFVPPREAMQVIKAMSKRQQPALQPRRWN